MTVEALTVKHNTTDFKLIMELEEIKEKLKEQEGYKAEVEKRINRIVVG